MLKFFATVDRGHTFEVLAESSVDATLFVQAAYPDACRVEVVSQKVATLRHYQQLALEAEREPASVLSIDPNAQVWG